MKWVLTRSSRPWVRTGGTDVREWVGWTIGVDLNPEGTENPVYTEFCRVSSEQDAKWLLWILKQSELAGCPQPHEPLPEE